jgi:zinc D-Ala-D-Ala dipeptidase
MHKQSKSIFAIVVLVVGALAATVALKPQLMRYLSGEHICLRPALPAATPNKLPEGFVFLKNTDPTILMNIKYYGKDNFVGRRIAGYDKPECILTDEAAHALKEVQAELKAQKLALLVYDCYRPCRAVADFEQWAENIADQKNKKDYYPNVDKVNFFKLGYVARNSSHSRGAAVDLTLLDKTAERVLDMGTRFDYMDEKSHPDSKEVTSQQRKNRMLLQEVMVKHGFIPYDKEWWHFNFKRERFPSTYFDFPIGF